MAGRGGGRGGGCQGDGGVGAGAEGVARGRGASEGLVEGRGEAGHRADELDVGEHLRRGGGGPGGAGGGPYCTAQCLQPTPLPRGALEEGGGGRVRRPQQRLDTWLEEVAKAVGGGYCWLQMPLKLALGVRGTVVGHRLGALEGGVPPPRPSNASLPLPPPPFRGFRGGFGSSNGGPTVYPRDVVERGGRGEGGTQNIVQTAPPPLMITHRNNITHASRPPECTTNNKAKHCGKCD